jgi:metal-responsive CopG/Arc/MetJ family transcriptional regulator
MSKVLSVTVDDWVYQEIENRRSASGVNRSEFVQEQILRGLGILPSNKEVQE